MPSWLVAGLLAPSVFLILDLVWLTIMTPVFYRPQLGDLMAVNLRPLPAVIFYLIYTSTLVVLVVLPALERTSPLQALLNGGLFGLAAYATYNLTNLATLSRWPLTLAIVDMLWGALLTATAAFIAVQLAVLLANRLS